MAWKTVFLAFVCGVGFDASGISALLDAFRGRLGAELTTFADAKGMRQMNDASHGKIMKESLKPFSNNKLDKKKGGF
ncbi:MAG: hypothetical protein J5478_01650 [Bacteroidales bacterium]|nr:hypothetical protein [Bacteroidales bacterium]MBR6423996.1 hypothetical protein [Bacteroidales bacterium]